MMTREQAVRVAQTCGFIVASLTAGVVFVLSLVSSQRVAAKPLPLPVQVRDAVITPIRSPEWTLGSIAPPRKSSAAKAKKKKLVVNLNQAGLEELQKLPGIGAKKALRILLWRRRHGRFRRVSQLVRVHGFGKKTVRKLRPYLTLKRPEKPPAKK